MVTVVPRVGPVDGDTAVTTGGVTKVNRSLAESAEVPPAVTTVTSTGPADPGGDVAVSDVDESP